jgi:superfamily II DNA or RNA helicase
MAPRLKALPAEVTCSAGPRAMLEKFNPRPLESIEFSDRDAAALREGIALLLEPADVMGSFEDVSASSLAMLKPLLQPSVLIEAPEVSVLPGELRPYQRLAVRGLMEREVLLLADDPGLGKTVSACVALAALVQHGEARRCLVICPGGNLHHWSQHLHIWAPSLIGVPVQGEPEDRERLWGVSAHVFLSSYETLVDDIEQQRLADRDLMFDVVILDGVHSIRLGERELGASLGKIEAKRRWALAGAPPRAQEGWLSIFGFLTPEKTAGRIDDTLPALRRQFASHVLRRRKDEVAEELPPRTRQFIWIDLDERQAQAYGEVLAEERYRLAKLGGAVTRTHIAAAVNRLKQVSNFEPDTYDGAKVRALVDLVEEISSAGGKLVVFSQFKAQGLDSLQPVLEAYGALRVDADEPEERRKEVLQAFREEAQWHVLLTEFALRTEGVDLSEATYIAHFDHSWNPSYRWRAEGRVHSALGPAAPLNIYEFWVADTIDENIFRLLKDRNLLTGRVSPEVQTAELEDHLSLDRWLRDVLEVPAGKEAQKIEAPPTLGTGALPGTAHLQERLEQLSPETLSDRVKQLMAALGFPEVEDLRPPDETGAELLARREEEGEIEQVLVRVMRVEKNVGVGLGRELLEDMQVRGDCQAAYLVSTMDFTPACKKLARESEGELSLVSGGELGRHLHILGKI